MTEDADPFDTADSSAAILAFTFTQLGADGLNELLSLIDTDQESLMRDSLELEQVGLSKPAAIVAEFAKQSPPAIEQWNPYRESDCANYISWREGHLRRQGYSRNQPS